RLRSHDVVCAGQLGTAAGAWRLCFLIFYRIPSQFECSQRANCEGNPSLSSIFATLRGCDPARGDQQKEPPYDAVITAVSRFLTLVPMVALRRRPNQCAF